MAANEPRIENIDELQGRLKAQAAEIERLQGELGQVVDRVSRREVTTPPIEEISLVFRKIPWTITDGGISAQDDWSSPT